MPRQLPKTFLAVVLLALIVANAGVYRTLAASRALRVAVLAAGKGKVVLLQTPSNGIILIDTGPNAGTLRALGEALPPWSRRIDAVVLTARTATVAGGLSEVMNRYQVANIVRVGEQRTPYGMRLKLDGASIEVATPAAFTISYGDRSLAISSSTPPSTRALPK